MLEIRGLARPGLGPVDLSLAAGACCAVTGASGAGKSLFLRAIADLDPAEGQVSWRGRDRGAVPAPVWRRMVGYLPAEPGWWAATPAEHFAEPPAPADLDRLHLDAGLLDAPVTRLSTGERQRLALLRLLANGPEVLLLDEPTAALDPDSVVAVRDLIAERLAAGGAAILVTHDGVLAGDLGSDRRHMVAGRLEARS